MPSRSVDRRAVEPRCPAHRERNEYGSTAGKKSSRPAPFPYARSGASGGARRWGLVALTPPGRAPRMGASRAGLLAGSRTREVMGGSLVMRSLLKVAGSVVLAVAFALPAYAEKCKFGDHERDENDPPLKCKKCEEISEELARKDPHVWTLQLKYDRPRRLEIKRETGTSEVYWFVAYEVTNIDKVARPCFVDVTAESDKGKNTYTYHDSVLPDLKDELRRVVGVKDGETLFTQTEMCLPGQGEENALPNKDGTVKTGQARIAFQTIQPGETRKCVAVFDKIDPEFDVLTIYFHGLTNTIHALNPESSPVAEGEYRLINDDAKTADPYRRKVVERIFAVEWECLGDEFAKTTRSIRKREEQTLRPKNLARDESEPAKYHDVGVFGTEIVEPEEKAVEGKKPSPFTFLGRKWIQVEKTIKSDLR